VSGVVPPRAVGGVVEIEFNPPPTPAQVRFWTGTGLSVNDATDVGLAVAFK